MTLNQVLFERFMSLSSGTVLKSCWRIERIELLETLSHSDRSLPVTIDVVLEFWLTFVVSDGVQKIVLSTLINVGISNLRNCGLLYPRAISGLNWPCQRRKYKKFVALTRTSNYEK